MYPQQRQEVIFQRHQVEQEVVEVPRDQAGARPGHGVQDKVVRRRHDSGQDDGRINHADANNREPSPGEAPALPQRDRGDGEADEEGISEVKGGHGS